MSNSENGRIRANGKHFILLIMIGGPSPSTNPAAAMAPSINLARFSWLSYEIILILSSIFVPTLSLSADLGDGICKQASKSRMRHRIRDGSDGRSDFPKCADRSRSSSRMIYSATALNLA